MKLITRKQAFALLREVGEGTWTCRTEKSGKGDYGRIDTYSFEDADMLRLDVCYYPPKTTASDLRATRSRRRTSAR
jgi:hypothetical protein